MDMTMSLGWSREESIRIGTLEWARMVRHQWKPSNCGSWISIMTSSGFSAANSSSTRPKSVMPWIR
ncbi:hypothetical protein D3C76_1663470 [compost metagenome]